MIEYFLAAFFVAQPSDQPATQPAAIAVPDAGVGKPSPSFRQPVIKADKLEVLGKEHQLVYSGRVRVQRGTTTVTCERLIASYTARQEEITKIVCVGGVEVLDGDRWAKGERAEFDNVHGVLEVTGSPQAKQGKNLISGSKVIFYVGRDTLTVLDATTIFDPNAGGPALSPKRK
jgi:lipopolysaccharide export system protein LptA